MGGMKGFFTKKETESNIRPDGKTLSCASCGLYKHSKTVKMQPFGNFKKGILNIGEAPGEREDEKGRLWQGKTGRRLARAYEKLGVDLFEDCLNINAVNCRPQDNATPTNHQIDCCNAMLVSEMIKKYEPSVIVLLGASALYSFLHYHWKKDIGKISKWRGFCIPDQKYKAWVCPVYHPSFVERGEKEVETIWIKDLKNALAKENEKLPKIKEPNIKVLEDLEALNDIKGGTAFDYETTGIKPHAKGHRVVCASIHVHNGSTYTFMLPQTRKERMPFLNYLQNPYVLKSAHNMKFEHTWSKVRLGVDVKGWQWDTMIAAHILDNRPGITGLKFQTYVNFGVVDYSSEVEPFLKSAEGGSNSINRIMELCKNRSGRTKLLEYCALDSYYEHLLAEKQMELIGYDALPF